MNLKEVGKWMGGGEYDDLDCSELAEPLKFAQKTKGFQCISK